MSRQYYLRNKHKWKKWGKERLARVRGALMVLMGGQCVRCGCTDTRILEVDHIHNDGHIDKKKGIRGIALHAMMLKHPNPHERFQLLCPNCHTLKTKGYW